MKSFSEYLAEAEAAENKSGTYASLGMKRDSRDSLHDWLEKQKINELVDPNEYHCTLVYSTTPVPEFVKEKPELPIMAKPKGWKIFGDKNMLVLVLSCEEAHELFDIAKSLGAKSDYPSYVPHVTVALNYTDSVPKDIPPFSLEFDKFKVGEIDENFSYNED